MKRGLRQQETHFGDLIRAAPRKSSSSNRYRELTVADLLEIDDQITSRGGGHPLLMRQVEPKLEVSSLADFPVLNPSSQGEIGCTLARPSPAQAETALFVAYLKDQVPILRSSISSLPLSRHEIAGLFIGMCRSRR